jgi:hypothetical protein
MEETTMMHPTPLWSHAARVQKHRWWRPLLWAGLLALMLLLAWQAATSAIVQAAVPVSLAEPWHFVDESKPGAPAAQGELTMTATVDGTTAPTEIAARFQLRSTMQALALQYQGPELAGLRLSQIEELSYCTHGIDGPRPYAVMLQLNVDADVTDGDYSWQGRLVYTPAYNGAVIQGEWQCWNTLTGKWWATGGPVAAYAPVDSPQSLGTLLAHFSNLGMSASTSAVILKAGDGWSDFEGEASPVVIGVEGERARLAFSVEMEPNSVLLPVVYQEPEQSPQAQDKKDNKNKDNKDKAKEEKKNNAWRAVEWGEINWDDFNWEDFEWDKVDWEHLDWGAFGWSTFGWNGDREKRTEAVRAFVADVKQCKKGGWEEMGFKNQGECVAYYAQEFTPSGFGWGLDWNDRDGRKDRGE